MINLIKNFVKRLFNLEDRLLVEKEASEVVRLRREVEELRKHQQPNATPADAAKTVSPPAEEEMKAKDARIAELQQQLEAARSSFPLVEKIKAAQEKIQVAKGKVGRPAKGRKDFHLMMDADLLAMMKVLKMIEPLNPQDIINSLFREWLEPKYNELVTDFG